MPSITCDIECVSFASSQGGGRGAGNDAVETGASWKDAGKETTGILTVFLHRAIHVNDVESGGKPRPAATLSCAGQKYTTEPLPEKTKKPTWDERFIFFNVSPDEKLNIRVTDTDGKGEYLGEVDVEVADVAKNTEVQDKFHLWGVKTTAQVDARLKFTYMSS